MSLQYGLNNRTISSVCAVFSSHANIHKAILYGSRAKGNFHTGSDIDLTFFGDNISPQLLGTIYDELDDLLLPYTFDLSVYADLKNTELREHIDKVGKLFYQRDAQ
ncbi:MAG: nucleotidyltransferase domain-containing protein [Fibrobacteria bacterium]|nr:nucleotidyltransferase domain-containing protein [Fibrobacteria bacterium]